MPILIHLYTSGWKADIWYCYLRFCFLRINPKGGDASADNLSGKGTQEIPGELWKTRLPVRWLSNRTLTCAMSLFLLGNPEVCVSAPDMFPPGSCIDYH